MAETKPNNFQQLEEDQIKTIIEQQPGVPPQIEMGVMGNVRILGFMGDILELYLPRVYDMFISLVGGQREDTVDSQGESADFIGGNQKPD